ncbi:MAG: hypothetical protein JW801_06070 [Bacteroidales bacterium]|nr:hypothetical protein [Bacteroidales bacterium]
MKLLALTTCCVDYYPQIQKTCIGGNSLNLAAMWKQLDPDSDISMIACVGKDLYAEMILEFLEKAGIDSRRIYSKPGSTASNQLFVDETGERFGIEGTWNGGVYETFLLSEEDWRFVSGQDLIAMPGNNPNFPEMIRRKKATQFLTVDYLDIENGLSMDDTLLYTDIAFIAARPELLDRYQALANETGKLVVVTLGAAGSCAFLQGESYHQAALPVDKVIDTTGCGDCYQAAFSLNYFRHRDIPRAMYEGALAASLILRDWGGAGNINR